MTWWAFGISLADRLLTVSVQPINASAPVSARILATVLAQLVMFAPLVVLRFTLLKDPMRPRPWVALAGFAVASVVRGLSVDYFLHYFGGLPLMPELRVFSGFLPTIIPLIVTAYVVNSLRERRRDLEVLLEIGERLERAGQEASAAVQQRNDELVDRVRSVLDTEIAAASAAQPTDVVTQLQRTATDVIRPLSHELATSFAAQEAPQVSVGPSRVGWRDVVGDASLKRPLMPGLTVLLLSGVWIPTAVVLAPIRWSLIGSLVLIYGLLVGANAVLRRLLPRRRPIGRLFAVFVACVVAGLVTGVGLRIVTEQSRSSTSVAVAAIFFVILVSMSMAIVNGVLTARSAVLAQTAASIDELRLQVLRTHQLQWFHQRALARALHGPVQSAVTAAALRLADAQLSGTPRRGLVDGVHADLVRVLDVLSAPEGEVLPLEASLARVVGMWEGLCDISARVDPVAAGIIDGDAVSRALVIDIITDATANAIRHGRAGSVSIRVSWLGGIVRLAVTDDGSPSATPGLQGLGSALLNDCAQEWVLTDTGAGHELIVVLPMALPGFPAHA